jgi:hypothetical protein
LIVMSSITSFDEAMRQLMLWPGSCQAANHPLRAYSCKICLSPLSDSRKTPQHPSEGGPLFVPGTLLGEGGQAPTMGESPKASARCITPNTGQAEELVAIIRPPSPKIDWWKPITDYLHLGIMSDDETTTRRLAHWAKGYLIQDELYRQNASGILQ